MTVIHWTHTGPFAVANVTFQGHKATVIATKHGWTIRTKSTTPGGSQRLHGGPARSIAQAISAAHAVIDTPEA